MALAFRSAATAANGAAPTSITVNKPSGAIDDDVLLAFVTLSADQTITTAPAGWILLDERATGVASGDCRHAVYYKVADTEGASYVWGFSAGADCAAAILAYEEVSVDAPIDGSGYRLMSTSATVHTAPSLTPGSEDTFTVTAFAVNPFFNGDTTFTTPSGLTARAEADPGAGTTNRAVLKVFDKSTATAVPTGEKVTTVSNSAKGVAFTVTLAPLAAAIQAFTVQPYRQASTATGCMVGWYDQNGYSGTNGLGDMEDLLDTFFPLVRVYHAPADWGTVSNQVGTAIDDGRLVLASHKLPKVANAWIAFHNSAVYDDGLDALVDYYKALAPTEIIVVFHHEPGGNSTTGSQAPTLGKPSDFVKAFRKFAKAFSDAGADNVKIGYCEVDSRARTYPNDPCYPGDDVIDVLCHDVYNWGNYSGHSWEEPTAMLAGIVADAKAANKPLIIGEIGSHPGGYSGHDRGQWITDLAAYLKTGDAATYILGFCYYHVDAHDPDNPHYWRFAQGSTAGTDKTDWIAAVSQDSHFLSEPISPSLRQADAPPGEIGGDAPGGGTSPNIAGVDWGRLTTTSGVPVGYGEMSGVASSPKGGLWGIRDSDSFGPISGVKNTLYWLTQTSRGVFSPHEITVTGATNGDWEDCFYSIEGGTGYIYIHDNRDGNSTGTNPRRLYKVAEPATPSTVTTVGLTATYYWKFPPSASTETCGSQQNCEAMAVFKGVIYAVQKTDAADAEVYRVGAIGAISTSSGSPTSATYVGTIGTHCPSCFSISADGTTVVTIQHGEVEVWRGKGDTIESLLTGKNSRIYRDEPGGNGEGADWWPYQSSDFVVFAENRDTFDYDVTVGTILTSGIPSNVAFGTPTLTFAAGPFAITEAGAIPSPADYEGPEESAGLDFGIPTLTFGAEPLSGSFLFSPPVVNDLPAILPETRGVQYRLWRHFGNNPAGVSVVMVDGHYTTIRTPTTLQLEAAGNREGIDFFLGGHIYTITSTVADALTADGYGSGITPAPDPPARQITWGSLAGGTWDDFAEQYGTWG